MTCTETINDLAKFTDKLNDEPASSNVLCFLRVHIERYTAVVGFI